MQFGRVCKESILKFHKQLRNGKRSEVTLKQSGISPNCLGALDGKHICMECPKNGGSAYYNYKNFHSIVLLAVCDAKYCFTLVDVCSYGRENDAAILSESAFGKLFDGGPSGLSIPSPRLIGNSRLPYVLIGDEIFPLKPWLMKP